MTVVNVSNPSENGRRGNDASSQLRADNDAEGSSILGAEEMSNASLYCMTPPAYAASAADTEMTLDAEAMHDEKTGMPPPMPYTPPPRASKFWEQEVYQTESLKLVNERANAAGPSTTPTQVSTPDVSTPNELPPAYFQEITQEAAIASVKRCTVFPSRPAVWLVKRKDIALSPLAATVLIKEGILKSSDLEIISASAGVKRDPNDPLSGFAFATYDTISDILVGLIEGPVEAAKQVTPMLLKHEQKRLGTPPTVRHSVRQETSPLARTQTAPEMNQQQESWTPPQAETSESWEPRVWSDAERKAYRLNATLEAAPNAAKEVAISTGKGLGRIIGAGLKAPMTFTHGVTRGFHNLPKMYGDDVREYENVTDFRSGLQVSAKSFGHGLGDGLRDFFVQPVLGAQAGGAKGFAKGFGKGVGNLVCKPSAGIVGLVGYSSVGVYRQLQWMKPPGKHDTIQLFKEHGAKEYSMASEETRSEVVGKWCQLTMSRI